MQKKREGNVTRLEDHRFPHQTERQREVKERLMDIANREPSQAPTAVINVSVLPSGKFESVLLNVEPEHVIPALSAMRGLMEKMEAYLTTTIAARTALAVAIAVSLVLIDTYIEPAIAAFIEK